jgi:hypothetical protein
MVVRLGVRSGWSSRLSRAILQLEGLDELQTINDLIETRISYLPACNNAPQPSTQPRAPIILMCFSETWNSEGKQSFDSTLLNNGYYKSLLQLSGVSHSSEVQPLRNFETPQSTRVHSLHRNSPSPLNFSHILISEIIFIT